MKKRSLLLGLSLMTAVSPVSLLAGPGHGNEEHSEGFFSRLKNAVFASYGEQLPFGRVGKRSEISKTVAIELNDCLLYTSPSPRDGLLSRMPSSA